MTTVELKEELHSNTRRTRITYRALVNGQEVAIKCYRKPLFGLIHWLRAKKRGRAIRCIGAPVPPVIFSGWVIEKKCFGVGVAFLKDYRHLRNVLQGEPDRARQMEFLRILGVTIASIHSRGIEQPDGNLTNFLLGPQKNIQMVDEDDIRIHPGGVSQSVAVRNLANIAARIRENEMVEELLSAYLAEVEDRKMFSQSDLDTFWVHVSKNRTTLELKRLKKKINTTRNFD